MNGFPDLTPSGRRALCRLLQEVEQRPEEIKAFAKAAKLSYPSTFAALDDYRILALLVRVQFPECRDELPKPYPATSQTLRRELRALDWQVCATLNVEKDELIQWLKTGELTAGRAALVKKRPAKAAKQGAA